jgi:hypothetical protein
MHQIRYSEGLFCTSEGHFAGAEAPFPINRENLTGAKPKASKFQFLLFFWDTCRTYSVCRLREIFICKPANDLPITAEGLFVGVQEVVCYAESLFAGCKRVFRYGEGVTQQGGWRYQYSYTAHPFSRIASTVPLTAQPSIR